MDPKPNRGKSCLMSALGTGILFLILALFLALIAGMVAMSVCQTYVDASGRHVPDRAMCEFWQTTALSAVSLSPVAALVGGVIGALQSRDDPPRATRTGVRSQDP